MRPKIKIVVGLFLLLFGLLIGITYYLYWILNNEKETIIDLGDGYSYFNSPEIYFDTMGFSGKSIMYFCDSLSGYIPVVYPNVVNYEQNKDFIIIQQEHNEYETKRLLKAVLSFDHTLLASDKYVVRLDSLKQISPRKNTIKQEDFINDFIQKSIYFQTLKNEKINYFIVNLEEDQFYGPLNRTKFQIKKDSLGVELEF